MRDQTIPRTPLRGTRKDPIGIFCSTRLSIDDQMLKKMRSGGAPHYRSKHRAYAVTTRVLPKRWHMAQALCYQPGVCLRIALGRHNDLNLYPVGAHAHP